VLPYPPGRVLGGVMSSPRVLKKIFELNMATFGAF